MNKLISVFCLLLVLASCANTYKIEGTSSITSLDGKMLFIRAFNDDGGWVTLDSTEIVHGVFSMKGRADSTIFASLYMNGENIMPLVMEKGNIKVAIAYDKLEAKGTPLNNALYEFIGKKNKLDAKIEELESREARMVMDGMELSDIHEELSKEGEALLQESADYIKKFIASNYDNVLGPNVFIMLCSGLPYPIMTPQIEGILQDAPYTFKSHKIVKEFVNKAKENKALLEEQQRVKEYEVMEKRTPYKKK